MPDRCRHRPARRRLTIPPQFDEPAGISSAAGVLYVADTNNHLIRVVDLDRENQVTTFTIDGLEARRRPIRDPSKETAVDPVEVSETALKPDNGQVQLTVRLELPEGYKSIRGTMAYRLQAAGKSVVVNRASLGKTVKLDEPRTEFNVDVPLIAESGKDDLTLTLTYYYCQEGVAGLCKVGTDAWRLPHAGRARTPPCLPCRWN